MYRELATRSGMLLLDVKGAPFAIDGRGIATRAAGRLAHGCAHAKRFRVRRGQSSRGSHERTEKQRGQDEELHQRTISRER